MILEIVQLLKTHVLTLCFLGLVGRILHLRFRHGFNQYDGPVLASITDYWKYRYTRRHSNEVPAVALHAKYGDIVRVGPRKLSFSDPQALKDIYAVNKGFVKVSSNVKFIHLYYQTANSFEF